jgi:CelD/BcsL family acetyltransferase involved in cellulose biosynthesis
VGATTATAELILDTISSESAFATLEDEWDSLVRSRARPSPFLLHGWLVEWWRHYGEGGELAVHVAYRNGRLVAALPLCVRTRYGLQLLSFLGGDTSSLGDLLLADGEPPEVGAALAERAASSGQDFADFCGLPAGSRLVAELGSDLTMIQRSEAPVLDLSAGWDAVYHSKLSSKKRNHHRRRRRQLAELGRVEVAVARTQAELEQALEDAFMLHILR